MCGPDAQQSSWVLGPAVAEVLGSGRGCCAVKRVHFLTQVGDDLPA